MLSIPVVSIVVFLTILIPSVAIGYFRGWKSSLFISLVVLALMGGFTALATLAYDNVWWDIFKGMFLDKHHGGITNIDALKEISEPTVVGIILMIAVPISYGLAVALHIPFKDKLKRSLYPKVQQNENKPEEFKLTKTRATTQRVLGATISGTTGLLMASTVAAGVQSIAEPTAKNNFLTDITKSLSKVYSFGQGGYDTAYQLAYEYIPNTSRPEVRAAFNALANINSNSLATLSNDLNYFTTDIGHIELLKLAQEGEAFVAILKALDQNPNAKFQLWNQAPGATDGIDSVAYFTELERVIHSTTLGLHLNNEAINSIISYIDSKMGSFETTDNEGGSTWYIQWQVADKALQVAKDELNRLNVELHTRYDEMRVLVSERDALIRELNARKARWAALGSNGSGGLVDQAEATYNLKNQAFTDASNAYTTYNQRTWAPAKQVNDDLFAKMQEADRKNGDAITLVSQKQDAVNDLSDQINQNTQLKNDAQAKLDDARRRLPGVQSQITQINRNISTQTTLMNDAQARKADADRKASEKQSLLNTETQNNSTLKSRLTQSETDLAELNKQISDIDRQIADAQRNKDQAEVSRLQALRAPLATQAGTVTQEIASLKQQISASDKSIETITRDMNSFKNQSSIEQSNIDKANGLISQYRNELRVKTDEESSLQTIIANTPLDINRYIAEDTRLRGLLNSANVELTQANDAQRLASQSLDQATKAYQENNSRVFMPIDSRNTSLYNAMNNAETEKNTAHSTWQSLLGEYTTLNGDISNPGSWKYTEEQLRLKNVEINTKQTEIDTLEQITIPNQEKVIADLKDPNNVNGEVYLRAVRDREKQEYQENIDRYNQLIRELLRS